MSSHSADVDLDALIRRVQAGQTDAYAQVVSACEAEVRVVAAALLPDRAAVDDVVQETFVTAFFKCRDFRPGTELRLWLKEIARNIALNHRKYWLRAQVMHKSLKAQAKIEHNVSEYLEQFSAQLVKADALAALRDCMLSLNQSNRQVVEDFYFRESSCEQIAAAHGRSSGWVRIVLHRSRQALAACLQSKQVLNNG